MKSRVLATVAGIGSGLSGIVGTTATLYNSIGGVDEQSSETLVQVIYRTAGVFSAFQAFVTSNTGDVSTPVVLRKNGSDATQTVSIPAGTTGRYVDSVHSDTIVSGDALSVALRFANTTGQVYVSQLALIFQAATLTVKKHVNSGLNLNGAIIRYSPIDGQGQDAGSGEVNSQCRLTNNASWANLQIYASANNVNAATACTFRNNGADTPVVVSVPAATTGSFEDTTHSTTTTIGDLVDVKLDASASNTGSISITPFEAIEETSTNGKIHAMVLGDYWNTTSGQNPRYIAAECEDINDLEALIVQQALFPLTAQNMEINVIANPLTTSTLTMRKNGVAVNQIVSIPTTTTGWFQDATNVDRFVAADLMSMKLDASSSTGAGNLTTADINWLCAEGLAPNNFAVIFSHA
jgi:hypothetical protein